MSEAQLPERPTEYRISDAERDAVIDRLRAGMAEGRITLYEFESRLDIVMKPAYVMGGWGIGLASHGVAAFSYGRDQKHQLNR